jgi:hypothetical protein
MKAAGMNIEMLAIAPEMKRKGITQQYLERVCPGRGARRF